MLGVIVNVITVILGSSIGLLFKKGIPKRVCNAANPTQIKNRFLFRAVSVTVGDISSISAFTFSFAIATDFCIAEAVQCSIAAIW